MSVDSETELRGTRRHGESLILSNAVGVRRVGRELRRARGVLSQRAAAARWEVPLATLAALEQGVDRKYNPQTLARFDRMLGISALDLYEQEDESDEDLASRINELGEHIEMINRQLEELLTREPAGMDESFVKLALRLTDYQRQLVTELMKALTA